MDSAVSWKRLCFLLIGLGVVIFLFGGFNAGNPKSSTFHPSSQSPLYAQTQQQPRLHLTPDNETADALTSEQCVELFPDLYHEVDRAVAYWRERKHIITADDIEVSWRDIGSSPAGAIRILIHDNELRVVEARDPTLHHMGYRGRTIGVLNLIHRAIESATAVGEKLPTIEAAIVVEDIVEYPDIGIYPEPDGTKSVWAWTMNIDTPAHKRHWLIPNYDFWYGWPMGSYIESRRKARQNDAPWTSKIPKVVWRGTGWLNMGIRQGLVDTTAGKPWADVEMVDYGSEESEKGLAIEEFCKYAMPIHTEGVTWSGRLKYILNCDSLPIIHELEWTTFWYHLLRQDGPDQNYVSVKRDWSDLEEKVTHYLNHPDQAQKIIDNHMAVFRDRYLTRAAISCYFRRLIHSYSTVSFTPSAFRAVDPGKSVLRRGLSYAAFFDAPRDFKEADLSRTYS